MSNQDLINFIWQIADLLRGPYRPPQYERVMLPMVVLRRFDCVLAKTKSKVLAEYARRKGSKLSEEALDALLNRAAGRGFRFHNRCDFDFEFLKSDSDQIDQHLQRYINGFSANVRKIFEFFDFTAEIERMREANILFLVVSKFCDVDLHPDRIDNLQMGLVFEDLIRRFNEQANETAGDHFTPREVIELMVELLFDQDDDLLSRPGTIRKLLDPTCGTGGMLAVAQRHLREHHEEATLYVYGQDYNKRSYAVAYADLLIKGHENSRVEYGDTLLADEDRFAGERFDYFLANPPFGVDWKKQHREVKTEHEKQGFAGRFGAGLPRVNDGSLLFLQHMLAKFEPVRPEDHKYGSRLAIVFNGSPLFTGGAGSGESDIRKWIIENDWLDAIVALPEQMFYNTGIGTYIWIVTNRKPANRCGKIQLIDARERWTPMRRSLGQKRRQISADDIRTIACEYGDLASGETSRVFENTDFGYRRVTVERPLRLRFQITDERKARFLEAWPGCLDIVQAIDAALGREATTDWNVIEARINKLFRAVDTSWRAPVWKSFRNVFTETDPQAARVVAQSGPLREDGNPTSPSASDRVFGYFPDPGDGKAKKVVQYEPDPALRDFENIPLVEDVVAYFNREVLPHVPDAWIDDEKTKIGYEINFNRHFYRYTPPRSLAVIDAELRDAEAEILRLLGDVTHATPASRPVL